MGFPISWGQREKRRNRKTSGEAAVREAEGRLRRTQSHGAMRMYSWKFKLPDVSSASEKLKEKRVGNYLHFTRRLLVTLTRTNCTGTVERNQAGLS